VPRLLVFKYIFPSILKLSFSEKVYFSKNFHTSFIPVAGSVENTWNVSFCNQLLFNKSSFVNGTVLLRSSFLQPDTANNNITSIEKIKRVFILSRSFFEGLLPDISL